MVNFKDVIVRHWRLVGFVALLILNIGFLSVGGAEARRSCEGCGWKQGGGSGWYADCMGAGNIELCRAFTPTSCKGYLCNGGGEENEFVPDEPYPG